MIKIRITAEALADILLAIHICPVEISGLGRVRKINEEEFLIEEVIVFKQSCSRGGTEFDENAYGFFLHTVMKEGRGSEINSLRLWWHSHVYSRARWSRIDNGNIRSFEGSDYIISIVGNKYNDLTVRFDRFGADKISLDGLGIFCDDIFRIKALMSERFDRMKKYVSENVTIVEEKS